MKLRFYFDYSDYRSYLMMHTLETLEHLPVSVQWIALDAYSLRALSGSQARDLAPNEREFLRREAQRFCMREGLEFVWQAERIHHGTALRAGMGIMKHHALHFEAYAQRVLKTMWGLGKTVDATMLRQILTELDLNAENVLSEREYFQYQDACLQEALADGVFDVPAVVVGEELICHFDQADELQRLVLMEWLSSLPPSLLCQTLAQEWLACSHDVFRQKLSSLTRKLGLRRTINTQIEGLNAIQHTLAIPSAQWHISKRPLREDLKVHICAPGATLVEVLEHSVEGAINICPQIGLYYDQNDVFSAKITGQRLFYAWVNTRTAEFLLCLRIDAGGQIHPMLSEHRDVMEETLRGWSVMSVSPMVSPDLNMARLCAHQGAHCIIRPSLSDAPFSEAYGCLASAWILEISKHGVAVIDAEAHRKLVVSGQTLNLNNRFKWGDAEVWQPPTPRTLLLCDKTLSFGELLGNAHIELTSRGASLLVTTHEQSSELISTRPYEKLLIGDERILLMPLNAEHLFVTELISHRLLDAFNQAPHESLPIFVSYWSELEFEMLDVIRPVMSAMVSTYFVPIVLLVGTQVVEIWLINNQGHPYRIEKEDDCFCLDMADLFTNVQRFTQTLQYLDISEQTYISRLQNIELASRK